MQELQTISLWPSTCCSCVLRHAGNVHVSIIVTTTTTIITATFQHPPLRTRSPNRHRPSCRGRVLGRPRIQRDAVSYLPSRLQTLQCPMLFSFFSREKYVSKDIISVCNASLMRCSYRLLSVLVHEGSHLSGHYFRCSCLLSHTIVLLFTLFFSYMCSFAQNDKWCVAMHDMHLDTIHI